MHCPNCGQQQLSGETKFCSRCGFPLGLVSEVLAHGGFLPQLAELHKKRKLLTRKNGLGFSAIWCLFFLLIMTPFWGIVNVDELAGISAIIGIFGGLIWMISSLIFLTKGVPALDRALVNQQPAQMQKGFPAQALPEAQSIPASVYTAPSAGGWRDTNDLQPGTVTESTTKLLDRDHS